MVEVRIGRVESDSGVVVRVRFVILELGEVHVSSIQIDHTVLPTLFDSLTILVDGQVILLKLIVDHAAQNQVSGQLPLLLLVGLLFITDGFAAADCRLFELLCHVETLCEFVVSHRVLLP